MSDNAVRADDRQLESQLREVESRLLARYTDTVGENRVRAVLAAVSDRFTGSRVTSFIPILVERAAGAELSAG